MAKYRHWLEQADVTILHTDVTLLPLWSPRPHLFTTALYYGVALHKQQIFYSKGLKEILKNLLIWWEKN